MGCTSVDAKCTSNACLKSATTTKNTHFRNALKFSKFGVYFTLSDDTSDHTYSELRHRHRFLGEKRALGYLICKFVI